MIPRLSERAARTASRLLSDDSVFSFVQRGLKKTLAARRMFERGVVRLLAGANMLSRQDLDMLLERVEGLNAEVDSLTRRVEALTERQRQAMKTGSGKRSAQ